MLGQMQSHLMDLLKNPTEKQTVDPQVVCRVGGWEWALAALWRGWCLTLGLKTNGQSKVLGSNICQPVAEANSFLTGILLENTLGPKQCKPAGEIQSFKDLHTRPLTLPSRRMFASRACRLHAAQWVSICLKLPWTWARGLKNQARASLLLLMYLVFVTSTHPQTCARCSQTDRFEQLSGTEVSRDRPRRAFL